MLTEGPPNGKLPANTLLRARASTTALALIYRAKLQPDTSLQLLDGVGIALQQHNAKLRWLHKESFHGWKIREGVSQKLHKKKKETQ